MKSCSAATGDGAWAGEHTASFEKSRTLIWLSTCCFTMGMMVSLRGLARGVSGGDR